MAQVVVKVRTDLVDSIAGAAPDAPTGSPPVDRLIGVVHEHGADLGAMHPSTADPELRTWFVVEVPDGGSATRLATSLRAVDGVEAAYEQAPPEPP